MAVETRWTELRGHDSGADYHRRVQEQEAEAGSSAHGEADLVASLVPAGARVLDAGCGTGRVGVRLVERGYDVVGVDADDSMLAVARELAPSVPWLLADLAQPPAEVGTVDLVLLAGNVVPLLAPGALDRTVAALAALLRPGGLLVAGFGLDAEHLPEGCPVTPVAEHDRATRAAGLLPVASYAGWAREPVPDGGPQGYVVSLHRRAAGADGSDLT